MLRGSDSPRGGVRADLVPLSRRGTRCENFPSSGIRRGLLTPSYFVRNALPNWNVGTLLGVIGFDFDAHDPNENLHDDVLDRVLNGSKSSDDFLMITHDADETSMFYYRLMNGTSVEDASVPDPTLVNEWWTEMNRSITLAKNRHDNFDAFVMEGSEHCTFGLVRFVHYMMLYCTLVGAPFRQREKKNDDPR